MKNILFYLSILFYAAYFFGDYGLHILDDWKTNNYELSENDTNNYGVCPKCESKENMICIIYEPVNFEVIPDKDSIEWICGIGLPKWRCINCNIES